MPRTQKGCQSIELAEMIVFDTMFVEWLRKSAELEMIQSCSIRCRWKPGIFHGNELSGIFPGTFLALTSTPTASIDRAHRADHCRHHICEQAAKSGRVTDVRTLLQAEFFPLKVHQERSVERNVPGTFLERSAGTQERSAVFPGVHSGL
jgi:hypothetical protein